VNVYCLDQIKIGENRLQTGYWKNQVIIKFSNYPRTRSLYIP